MHLLLDHGADLYHTNHKQEDGMHLIAAQGAGYLAQILQKTNLFKDLAPRLRAMKYFKTQWVEAIEKRDVQQIEAIRKIFPSILGHLDFCIAIMISIEDNAWINKEYLFRINYIVYFLY